MSRHKFVKTMNLDDELDDYDGADLDDQFEEAEERLSAEDKALLAEGTLKVRNVLGPAVQVSDKEIQDSLWHYYYDVDKTINYLLNAKLSHLPQKTPPDPALSQLKVIALDSFDVAGGVKAKIKKRSFALESGLQCQSRLGATSLCDKPFSAEDFFRDSPWLNIPLDRRGEIMVEPLYPRGGLLGGSSSQTPPKVSKLAALAAARKKKENQTSSNPTASVTNTSVFLLDKLGTKSPSSNTPVTVPNSISTLKRAEDTKQKEDTKSASRYPIRLRRNSNSAKSEDSSQALVSPSHDTKADDSQSSIIELIPNTSPSKFAKTVFGSIKEPLQISLEAFQTLHTFPLINSGILTESSAFAGPSPDDVVLKAQDASKGSKGPKVAKKTTQLPSEDKAGDGLAQNLQDVTIDERSKIKSKNLDVVAELERTKLKNAMNFVVIGHVDAGKSTLMGRLLYDLKVVDQRTVDKYRKDSEKLGKSSFALAWVLDQGTEERNRGVTIDIAMNKFETANTSFTILDAPGHQDFIPNMIAGASQADFAVLVIDASIGSFESGLKGQTKEHALLVRSIGLQRIIVAVNKLDTVQWSRDRFDEIQQQVSAFLTTAGFQPKNIMFVPCSGLTGDNITRRSTDKEASWYGGPILIEQLEASDIAKRALEKPLRMTIADVFRGGVQNPLSISGRLDSGSVQIGEKITAMPADESALVKSIETDARSADWAVAGQNVVLHLTDIESKHLKPGDVICSPSAPIKNITSFKAKILAFDHVTPMHVDVHRGRLHVPGRITQLIAVLDKSSGIALGKKKPRLIQPGAVARIAVELENAVPLEAPGRVVLRAGGETVAAGLLE